MCYLLTKHIVSHLSYPAITCKTVKNLFPRFLAVPEFWKHPSITIVMFQGRKIPWILKFCITHPRRCDSHFFKVWLSNTSYGLSWYAHLVIFLLGECHITPLMIRQCWFCYWLSAARQHAITWTDVDSNLHRLVASLGHTELRILKTSWNSFSESIIIDINDNLPLTLEHPLCKHLNSKYSCEC